MRKNILIIQGHPDTSHDHLGHALAAAYEKGARESGYEIRTIYVANIDFPLLRTYEARYTLGQSPGDFLSVMDGQHAGSIESFF